ncbi:MAG: hypothetical protein KDE45_05880, partial [Caldilineaceae bacterium]|nr:hypothetical protein [Caldilineaceae bacterium]
RHGRDRWNVVVVSFDLISPLKLQYDKPQFVKVSAIPGAELPTFMRASKSVQPDVSAVTTWAPCTSRHHNRSATVIEQNEGGMPIFVSMLDEVFFVCHVSTVSDHLISTVHRLNTQTTR